MTNEIFGVKSWIFFSCYPWRSSLRSSKDSLRFRVWISFRTVCVHIFSISLSVCQYAEDISPSQKRIVVSLLVSEFPPSKPRITKIPPNMQPSTYRSAPKHCHNPSNCTANNFSRHLSLSLPQIDRIRGDSSPNEAISRTFKKPEPNHHHHRSGQCPIPHINKHSRFKSCFM